jgi:DNA-binding transcriptional LysR family regulator
VEIRQLMAFRAVVQTHSITRAAAVLGYSQSAVTAQIQNLESTVRVRLFERRRDGVRLTPSGERFLPYANRLLRLSEQARSAVAPDAPPETMVIGASESMTTYRLPDVVQHLHTLHPTVRLSLHPFREGPEALAAALGRGEVDVVLTHSVDPRALGRLTRRLAPEPLALVAAPGHPLAGLATVADEDVRLTQTLIVQPDCVYDAVLHAALDVGGPRALDPLQLGTIEAVKIAARSGLGIALLPRIALTDALADAELVELAWCPPVPVHSYLMWDAEQTDPRMLAALEVVLDAVCPRWAGRDPAPAYNAASR